MTDKVHYCTACDSAPCNEVQALEAQRDALVDLVAHIVRAEREGSQQSLEEQLSNCGDDIQDLVDAAIEAKQKEEETHGPD